VAAARFVLSGRDLDRNVQQTATQIAEQVTRRLEESAHLAVLNAAPDHRVPEWHSRESTSILRR
jgi:hypothetical protein